MLVVVLVLQLVIAGVFIALVATDSLPLPEGAATGPWPGGGAAS